VGQHAAIAPPPRDANRTAEGLARPRGLARAASTLAERDQDLSQLAVVQRHEVERLKRRRVVARRGLPGQHGGRPPSGLHRIVDGPLDTPERGRAKTVIREIVQIELAVLSGILLEGLGRALVKLEPAPGR